MATQEEILRELSSQEEVVNTADLAKKVGTTEGSLRSHLSKLKNKEYVDGSTKEGWVITSAGLEALERGEKIPTTPEDVGADTESKLKYYGQLATVGAELILATNEMILTGDPEDLDHVWDAMTQMDVPIAARRKWFNLWRNYLKQGIPPHLRDKVMGSLDVPEGEDEDSPSAITREKGKDYIIADDEPIRVGEGLGDFSLRDAKDILSIRALRSRLSGSGQAGAQSGAGSQPGSGEKVSDLLTAIWPYINKGSDIDLIKEILGDKLELQRQDIISRIPQREQPSQPKSAIEQISEFVTALGNLKEAGPLIRSILGTPEPPNNPPSTSLPVSLAGPDGQPIVMDLGQVINWRKFLSDERRADETHESTMGLFQTVRENIPDGIQAVLRTVSAVKGDAETKTTPDSPPPVFACGTCKTQFSPPEGWAGQPLKCPNPECGREYTKEELLA